MILTGYSFVTFLYLCHHLKLTAGVPKKQPVLITSPVLETGRQCWELQNILFESYCQTRTGFVGNPELPEFVFSERKLYMLVRYKQPAAVLKLATRHSCSGIKNASNTAGQWQQGTLPATLDKNTVVKVTIF